MPEALLWGLLKTKPMGLKFRSQHPLDDFVVDFYCHAAKTVFEIDGIAHDMGDQPQFDAERDAKLSRLGFRVIRFPAKDVLIDPEAIADRMVRYCLDTPPPSGLRPATSPRGGGFSRVST